MAPEPSAESQQNSQHLAVSKAFEEVYRKRNWKDHRQPPTPSHAQIRRARQMIDPAKRLDQIAQRQRDKTAVKAATAKPVEADVALGSSSPPDATSGLRTSLFATQSNDPRPRFREAVVYQGPLRIRYSGPSLN